MINQIKSKVYDHFNNSQSRSNSKSRRNIDISKYNDTHSSGSSKTTSIFYFEFDLIPMIQDIQVDQVVIFHKEISQYDKIIYSQNNI